MRENTGREIHSDFHGMQTWQEPEQQWFFNSKLDTARREEPQPTRQTSKAVVSDVAALTEPLKRLLQVNRNFSNAFIYLFFK